MEATQTTTQTGAQMKKRFDPLPQGEYLVRLNRVTETKSKAGTAMLKVCYEVVKKVGDSAENESKSKGRLIFENILIGHSNPKVNEIANKRTDQFLKAVGVGKGLSGVDGDIGRIGDYTELPFIADVGIRQDEGYGASNFIKKFKARG